MKILFFFILLNFVFQTDQTASLQVIITNVQITRGKVIVNIYDKKRSFLKVALITSELPSTGRRLTFPFNLHPGIYAVSAYQDTNGNGKLDFGFLHIPKEPAALGNNFRARFSAPDFEDCQIALTDKGLTTEIQLR